MSTAKDIFVDYPQALPAGSDPNSPVYTRLPGFHAVHGWRADAAGLKPVQTFEDDSIALMQGDPDPKIVAASPDKLSPVYALQPGGAVGSMAVPTGRVFIRFADNVNAGDRETEIKKAGYEVDEKVDYAPNAAWLRAQSGSIADALKGIDSLRKFPDVENVEPQMLMQGSYR